MLKNQRIFQIFLVHFVLSIGNFRRKFEIAQEFLPVGESCIPMLEVTKFEMKGFNLGEMKYVCGFC